MENASYIALSHQAALWRQMEIVANNMANVNTPAFKAEQVMFTDYLVRPPATAGLSNREPSPSYRTSASSATRAKVR